MMAAMCSAALCLNYRDAPIPLPTNDLLVKMDILFLLENQMPWVVLKEMHSFIGTVDDNATLQDRESALHDHIANKGVRPLLEQLDFISGSRESNNNNPGAPAHLLDVVHYYLKPTTATIRSREQQQEEEQEQEQATINIVVPAPPPPPPRDRLRRMGRWRRATEYRRYANVQLKRRRLKKNKVDSILDVRLKRGTLWIPPVPFDPCTWTMLRNLMALEDHMDAAAARPVTAYCFFMSQLACTAEDVELLRSAGIVDHFLPTDKDAAQRFANLCAGVVFDAHDTNTNYLNATWHQLEARCRRPGNTWLGSFLHKYWIDSLHVSAFLVAAMLFLLQAAQVTIAAIALADQLSGKRTYTHK
ncbi:hypothetical protein BS78_03G411400 [Paspalum vaginatum]|nr:hypothetical protein BS78_03G411400 [Paspalum vaginatum]